MSDDITMRFELTVNDEPPVTGGVNYGTNFISLTGIMRDPDIIAQKHLDTPRSDREQLLRAELAVTYTAFPEGSYDRIEWIRGRKLTVGDEVTVRVLGPGPVDEPASRIDTLSHKLLDQDADYAAELLEAEKEFEAAMDSLYATANAPSDEFLKAIRGYSAPLSRYRKALSAAIEKSDGEEKDEHRFVYEGLRRFPGQLLGSLTRYRHRMGFDDSYEEDRVSECR